MQYAYDYSVALSNGGFVREVKYLASVHSTLTQKCYFEKLWKHLNFKTTNPDFRCQNPDLRRQNPDFWRQHQDFRCQNLIIRGLKYDHLGVKIWSSRDESMIIWGENLIVGGSKCDHAGVKTWSSRDQNMITQGSKYSHLGVEIWSSMGQNLII